MKSILIILTLISSVCFGQAKDTLADYPGNKKVDSVAIKQQQIKATVQAIEFVLADMKSSLYGKITAEEYSFLIKIQDAYVVEKNKQFTPAKKNK